MKQAHETAWKKSIPQDPVHWLQQQCINYYRYGRMRYPDLGQEFICFPRTRISLYEVRCTDQARFNADPGGYAPYIEEDLARNRTNIIQNALKFSLNKITV